MEEGKTVQADKPETEYKDSGKIQAIYLRTSSFMPEPRPSSYSALLFSFWMQKDHEKESIIA